MTEKTQLNLNPKSQDQTELQTTKPSQTSDPEQMAKVPKTVQTGGSSPAPQFESIPLFAGLTRENVVQGLVWAEILGKPRSRSGRRRF